MKKVSAGIWQAALLAVTLPSLLVFAHIHDAYTVTLPHQPDIATCRTIPLEAKGGIIYGNSEEARWWKWSTIAFSICCGLGLLTAATLEMKRQRTGTSK